MSSDREAARREFLQANGLGAARRVAMAGDASTRSYERLFRSSGSSLILMDQPPSLETQPCPPGASDAERAALGYNALARLAAGRVEAFAACAAYLRSLGLSAPEVIAFDAAAGLAVLEDLGDDLFARLMERGADEAPLYDNATDVLARLHQETPPSLLTTPGAAWPLLDYDALALTTATDIFVEWWPRWDPRVSLSPDSIAEWRALWAPIAARGAAGASVFCHRDFHAENLIWLPHRAGAARTGLLDFQDAVRAHPAWDLSMLLHDARRDVSAEREAAVLDRYFVARPGLDRHAFIADFHALGALNIVRVLGIFARLIARDGKPRYQAFMPRLWLYLDRCLGPRPAGPRRLAGASSAPGGRLSRPHTAMIMAAGLGTRMRPLTLDRPKALVSLAGRPLIDHVIDRLAAAGVQRVVVNVHAFADAVEAHLKSRADVEVMISDERAALLETGGGLKAARPLLGEDPILVANVDSIWIEPPGRPVLDSLIAAWNGRLMDDLLLLAPVGASLGFDGPGDFHRATDGRLVHRGADAAAPFAQAGVHMLSPGVIDTWPSVPHSVFAHWMEMAARGRLHGAVMDGVWMHVGDPAARDAAESRLALEA